MKGQVANTRCRTQSRVDFQRYRLEAETLTPATDQYGGTGANTHRCRNPCAHIGAGQTMRRAMRIDPDTLHYLTLDEDLKGIVNHLITRYKNNSHYNIETTDRDFMVASLYYLLHDTEAAGRFMPDQDTHISAKNLHRLIHQK